MNLKSWLRRVPQPQKLRCDGKKTVLVGQGKNKWRDALITIEGLQPSLLEALDGDDAVIRATQLQGDDDDEGGAKPVDAKDDDQLSRIARIVLEATDAGAKRHAEAYQLAFQENTKLVALLADRMSKLEGAWQTTLENRAAELAAGAGGDEALGPLLTMLAPLMAKMEQPKKLPAKPNGKDPA